MKVTDERLGQLSESQISQPILLPDELSKILANLSVSPDTALRHIDALMGAEFTDMLVHEGEKGGLCLDAALQGRVFKNRIKIWYKKWCYIGASKLLIFNTLTYKIALCKFV